MKLSFSEWYHVPLNALFICCPYFIHAQLLGAPERCSKGTFARSNPDKSKRAKLAVLSDGKEWNSLSFTAILVSSGILWACVCGRGQIALCFECVRLFKMFLASCVLKDLLEECIFPCCMMEESRLVGGNG